MLLRFEYLNGGNPAACALENAGQDLVLISDVGATSVDE